MTIVTKNSEGCKYDIKEEKVKIYFYLLLIVMLVKKLLCLRNYLANNGFNNLKGMITKQVKKNI